jgi:hypothetical protein
MGNGNLFYGVTYSWNEICDLVREYIKKDDQQDCFLDKKLRCAIKEVLNVIVENRAENPLGPDEYPDMCPFDDRALETEDDYYNVFMGIFGDYPFFCSEIVNDDLSLELSHNPDLHINYCDLLTILFGLDVCRNGACCNVDDKKPFIIGKMCDGGVSRGEASGKVTLLESEETEKVDQFLRGFGKETGYMIISDDCDFCT